MAGSEMASDRQALAGILIAGGGGLTTIGGALIGVGATENSGSHHSIWMDPLFLSGLVLAVGGLAVFGVLASKFRKRSSAKIILDPVGVFNLAISTLEAGSPWEMVRLYAPVGLWDKSDSNVPDAKTRWLSRLAEALSREGDAKNPEVEGLKGVFGLPKERALYDDYAIHKLEIFEHTKHTELRYFPPEEDPHPMAAPGMGIIVFENRSANRYMLVFAFAGKTTGEESVIVRSGFSLRDNEIGRLVADWFDERAWKKAEDFVLRGPYRDRKTGRVITVELGSALRDLENRYYS